MDEKRIVVRIDFGDAPTMALEMQISRGDALEVLTRRVRRRPGRAEKRSPGLFEARALTELSGEITLNFGWIIRGISYRVLCRQQFGADRARGPGQKCSPAEIALRSTRHYTSP